MCCHVLCIVHGSMCLHTQAMQVRCTGHQGACAGLTCNDGIAGLRLGMYGPLKTVVGADTDPTVLKKIAAGSASGAIATFITNPIELLKTRLQSNSAMAPLQVLQKIVRENGVTGLWKGTMPSAVRLSSFAFSCLCTCRAG